jgi:hypothetical protein
VLRGMFRHKERAEKEREREWGRNLRMEEVT